MQGNAARGGAIDRRPRRHRTRLVAASLAAAALAGGLSVAPGAEAAPTAPAAPEPIVVDPAAGAIAARPANSTYARQVLRSLRFGDPRARGPEHGAAVVVWVGDRTRSLRLSA